MGKKPAPEPVCDLCFPKQCTQEEPERTVTLNEVLIGSTVGLVVSAIAGFAIPAGGLYTAIAAGSGVLLVKLASYADIKTKSEPVQNVIEYERDYSGVSAGLLGGLIIGGVGSNFLFNQEGGGAGGN